MIKKNSGRTDFRQENASGTGRISIPVSVGLDWEMTLASIRQIDIIVKNGLLPTDERKNFLTEPNAMARFPNGLMFLLQMIVSRNISCGRNIVKQ